ncbi:MAG: tyrosine-type recombinase/integrase [Bacillota bacterium]|jgi:integrase|nr:tyrosine-type recombinase/integrase [Bacillota bacterium]
MGQGRLFVYDNDYLYGTYSKLFKELKIDATGHTLRHTFATNCYEIGIPPHIVQAGWDTLSPNRLTHILI